MTAPTLDVITIGRSSVDLYGQQIGGRLEDMASFSKAVGGSPTNMAVGTARLGLRSALITRVGDEHMGRFIREQLGREGVDTRFVTTDPKRLTALVILGVRDSHSFPLIFYRTDCADAAIDESDIDEAFVASAKAFVVSGTHFSMANTAEAQMKGMALARKHGRRVAFDIDYRPNLWGLAGHGAGEERYIRSENVTAHLQPILGQCDLIVGTEEELNIAGGSEDALTSINNIRALTKGTIVCKRGPMGCVVFPGAIPASIEDGIKGPGFPVEVYNVLGAGDAFMSGFLRGWLKDEPWETCAKWANACGAFAVSRLLCAPEYPSWEELQFFLAQGSSQHALRKDAALNQIHWSTTRRPQAETLMALAIDHRAQFEEMADAVDAPRERIGAFKKLAVAAAEKVVAGRPGFGMLIDGIYGREALFAADRAGFWLARPLEKPGSRPLELESEGNLSVAATLNEWPATHAAKVLCFYHPDDPPGMKSAQEAELKRVSAACRMVGRELLVEIIASKAGLLGDDTMARVIERLYAIGVFPDWWKLESQPSAAAWSAVEAAIRRHDPHCRGVVLLGLDAPEPELVASLREAKGVSCVKGFAVGRTIFGEAARDWFAGRIDDAAAVAAMTERFGRLVAAWQG